MRPTNDNSVPYYRKFAKVSTSGESCRWKAVGYTRILDGISKFILGANRNSSVAGEHRGTRMFQGRSFRTAAQLKLTRATISTRHEAVLVSKLWNIIAAQTTRDLPGRSSERDKRNQRACSFHNYTLL